MLTPLRPVRAPKPARRRPDPDPAPSDPISAEPAAPAREARTAPPADLATRLGRWRRVSSWWALSAAELESALAMMDAPWRPPLQSWEC